MKTIIPALLLFLSLGTSAQNDSILPNVYATYVMQDTYVNPEVNIWTSVVKFEKADFITGEVMGEDTIMVNALDHNGFLLPAALIALDEYRAYIKRYDLYFEYEQFSENFGDEWELLYDFSLNVGDTACMPYDWSPYYPPPPPPWRVLQVDTIYVQGQVRRVLKIGYPPTSVRDTWIQGMGSVMNPLAPKLRYFELTRKLCGAVMSYEGPSPIDSNYYSSSCSISPVRDVEGAIQMRIFPNPTREYLTVSTEAKPQKSVTIIDQAGHVVYRNALSNVESKVPTSGLSPGMYFLKMEFRDGTVALEKFVKE